MFEFKREVLGVGVRGRRVGGVCLCYGRRFGAFKLGWVKILKKKKQGKKTDLEAHARPGDARLVARRQGHGARGNARCFLVPSWARPTLG